MVPPLYQLVLVAATEGSIFHVIVTAAFCDGRTTVTCAGNTTQTQSTHILVLLLFVLHHLLVTRLYDYTLLQHIYETEFHPKYTQVNTTREDERRTLRQLCKRLYKRPNGSSAQQSTATDSSSLQGLWRQQTVAYEQRPHTGIHE